MGDERGWVAIPKKVIDDSLFLEIGTIRILMQRTHSKIFHFRTSLQVLCFRLSSCWRKMEKIEFVEGET